jgi:hypothetical protein
MYRPTTQIIAPAPVNISPNPTTVPFLQPQTQPTNKRTQRTTTNATSTQNRKKKFFFKFLIFKRKPKIEECTLPEDLQSIVPESLIFQDLEQFEKRIDDFISQKKIQMKHLLAETKMVRRNFF